MRGVSFVYFFLLFISGVSTSGKSYFKWSVFDSIFAVKCASFVN